MVMSEKVNNISNRISNKASETALNKTASTNEYEKPSLTVKRFLLESNITVLSNIDPNQTGDNIITTVPGDWWD